MNPSSKIISFESAATLFADLRAQGKRIVMCHGLFELVHPGHIVHLEEARALGDVLVTTLTADKFVNKGPGRPLFKEQMRAQTMSALGLVDYVVVVPFPGSAEAIDAIRPHFYCRGKEYESSRRTDHHTKRDAEAAARVGARVCYVGSTAFSSTRLLNQHFDHLSPQVKSFCETLSREISNDDFRAAVESFADLKVLVIGDTIFDRYSNVKVQGLTSKNRIISGRFLNEETQCGGALAVYRHVKQFVRHTRYLSLVGVEPWVDPLLRSHIPAEEDRVVREPSFTTIIKQRYVEPRAEGKELGKLFSVNYLDAGLPPQAALDKVEALIRAEIANADIVLLLDFGHGLMQPHLRKLVQESAPLLALNCQTNSNNHGFNIISRQYQRADAFSLDEQELLLSCGRRQINFQEELSALQGALKSRYAWLTRGAVQTIGLSEGGHSLCPPLEVEVVDTIGAGDAFFSVASLSAARKLPISLATFLGQLAGAQAVKIIGNAHPISKEILLQSGLSLLNF